MVGDTSCKQHITMQYPKKGPKQCTKQSSLGINDSFSMTQYPSSTPSSNLENNTYITCEIFNRRNKQKK